MLSKAVVLSCFISILSSFVELGARASKEPIWSANTCGGGYTQSTYGSSGVYTCDLCSAGSACSGTSGSGSSCSSPNWSQSGMGACEPIEEGYGYSSSSSRPSVCASGQRMSGNACVDCDDDGYACLDPSAPAACSTDSRFGYSTGSHCDTCPAGYSCSSYVATACDGGYGSPEGKWMDEPSGTRSCD